MSIISSRKSLSSSILKSTGSSRNDSIKKTKILRFEANVSSSVKLILKELEDNPNAKSYQNLVYKLSEGDVKDDELRKILKEAIESVPLIKKDHILLVQSMLSIRWISRTADIIELYHEFILSLMTSNDFLVLSLSKIIGCFVPHDAELDQWVNGSPTIEIVQKMELVHKLIKRSFEVMPMIPVTLHKQIRLEFPFYKLTNVKIVAYIENLLQMLEYFPSMIYDVLELIFENLLLMDVNVPREKIEESEEVDDDDLESIETDSEKMKLPAAETLDLCMEKVLGYFHTKLKEDSTSDKNEQKMIIQAIFNYFDQHILKTYTKHVHYMLFYIASLRKSYLVEFLNYLWSKVIDRNQSATIRQTAIGYLSSFLSRSKFLSLEMMMEYLKQLADWSHTYIKTCDFNRNKNPKAHVVFYSICQAIFYVIAFRQSDLTRCDKGLEFLLNLNLWPIIKHPMNPLNVCLPAIATIFDNVTTKYQILFCHTIILSNASKSLTTVYANEQHRPEEVLESVFPFEPYLLKKSGKRIEPLFLSYQPDEEDVPDSAQNSPPGSRKRTRYESTSGDLEDFIIREHKIQRIH